MGVAVEGARGGGDDAYANRTLIHTLIHTHSHTLTRTT
jgi:hypothetical protein